MNRDLPSLAGEPSTTESNTVTLRLIELNTILFRLEKREVGFNTLIAWFKTSDPDRDIAGVIAQKEYQQQAEIDEANPPENPEPYVRRTIRHHLIGAAMAMKDLDTLYPQIPDMESAETALQSLIQ